MAAPPPFDKYSGGGPAGTFWAGVRRYLGLAAAPALSAAGDAVIYFDTVAGAFKASVAGAAYQLLVPTALPPNGSAGGDLGGTYPNPTVIAAEETSGPTRLVLGAVADGSLLKRVGATLVGYLLPMRELYFGVSSIAAGGNVQLGPFTCAAGETPTISVYAEDNVVAGFYSEGSTGTSTQWYFLGNGVAGQFLVQVQNINLTNPTHFRVRILAWKTP